MLFIFFSKIKLIIWILKIHRNVWESCIVFVFYSTNENKSDSAWVRLLLSEELTNNNCANSTSSIKPDEGSSLFKEKFNIFLNRANQKTYFFLFFNDATIEMKLWETEFYCNTKRTTINFRKKEKTSMNCTTWKLQ